MRSHVGFRAAKVRNESTQTACKRPNPSEHPIPFLFKKRSMSHEEEREMRALNKGIEASSMLFVAGQCFW